MRVAWFSPLQLSGELFRSSLYSHTVLPHLSDWDIELFVADADFEALRKAQNNPRPTWLGRPVHHFLSHFLRDRASPFDVSVYNLEDNAGTAFIRRILPISPGLVIFHDLNFSRMQFVELAYASTGEALDSQSEGAIKLGEWKQRGWSTELVTSRSPYGGIQTLRDALVCGVRNAHAAHEVRSKLPGVPIELCRFGLPLSDPESRTAQRKHSRASFGYSESDFVVGFEARNLIEERARLIVEGLAGTGVKLLWFAPSSEAVSCAQNFRGRADFGDALKLAPVRSWADYRAEIMATDVWLSLRFDVLREVPVSTYFALEAGLPTVGTAFGPLSEIPSSAMIQIEPGQSEMFGIRSAVDLIRQNNDGTVIELSKNAQAFMTEFHSSEAAAGDVRAAIEQNIGLLEEGRRKKSTVYTEAEQKLTEQFQSVVQLEGPSSWN